MEFIAHAVIIGIGATFIIDVWALFLNRVFKVPLSNYALFGRWVVHCLRGRFKHKKIAEAKSVDSELAIGWIIHYAIGIVFAGLLLMIWGIDWARTPTLGPALAFGFLTVTAPFFIMHPGMGLGVLASKAPRPNSARLKSVLTHTIFGVGLYISALLSSRLV